MLSPLNGLPNTEKIRDIDPRLIAERWRQELGVNVGEEFESLSVIEHWRCNTTHFEWYEPAFSAGTGALYAQLQKFDWYYMPDKWEFRAALELFHSGSRLLEIGVGPGFFLNAARNLGLEGAGIELNPAAAAVARNSGFDIYEEDVNTLAGKLGPVFDGVCAFQVLEHIPNPLPLLKGMLDLLRPGGKLALSVPNAAFHRFIDPDHIGLLDQPPHHVSHWDAFVFRQLENIFSVRTLAVKREPLQPYHVDWVVSSIVGQLHKSIAGRLLANRLTINFAKRLLKLGLRKLIPGHSLLVVFEKIH